MGSDPESAVRSGTGLEAAAEHANPLAQTDQTQAAATPGGARLTPRAVVGDFDVNDLAGPPQGYLHVGTGSVLDRIRQGFLDHPVDAQIDCRRKCREVPFAWLTLALAMAWLGSALGLTEALRALNPRAAWIGGVIAVTGAVAFAMHQMQYVEVNAVLATSPDYIKAVEEHGINGTAMEDATVLIQLIGLWLGPIILVAALARAGTVAWWKFACVPIWVVLFVFTGSISPVFAAIHLVLLPPFLAVAQSLVQTEPLHGRVRLTAGR